MSHSTPISTPGAIDAAGTTAPTPTHDGLVLTAKFLPIVAPFLAVGDPRYYLRGINVRPLASGGVMICASNGHILGAYHDPDGVCAHEVTIYVGSAMLAACSARIGDDRQVVMRSGRLAVVDKFNEEICIQAGNPIADPSAPFPRIEKLLPAIDDLQPGLIACINGMLLTKLTSAVANANKAQGRSSRRGFHGLVFFNKEGNADALSIARFDFDTAFLAVIMPLRPARDVSDPLPTWVLAQRAEGAAA